MYNGVNVKIERLSKLIHFVLTKLTVVGLELPALAITMINYFVYDLSEESFFLPEPLM